MLLHSYDTVLWPQQHSMLAIAESFCHTLHYQHVLASACSTDSCAAKCTAYVSCCLVVANARLR
jgi:hypothetical protein